jgi:8-oxo-dGTP pyrophosphatase MutT (NUDIX family)
MSAAPTIRPVDAAGLVLLRGPRDAPEILLGRRHAKAGFLPDIYVVPGGRVDPEDHLPSGFQEQPHPLVLENLSRGSKRRPPIAFLRAALRETHEETGLVVGRRSSDGAAAAAPVWRAYAAAGLRPDFGGMDFLLRAITPVGSRRRYNTRFFLADGSEAAGELRGNGELLDLRWWKASALDDLNIVDVTQVLIRLALARWRVRAAIGSEGPKLLLYRKNCMTVRALAASRA